MTVQRIYVEKKKQYAVEANHLERDIQLFLGVSGLHSLRIINRYDVEGISEGLFHSSIPTIFSEPQVDLTYTELPAEWDHILAVEYLPGQFDQRADSCSQCIQILSQGQKPAVRTVKIYLLDGPLTEENLTAIKAYLINPIDSREADLAPVETLAQPYDLPQTVESVMQLRRKNRTELQQLSSALGLAMDLEDLQFCQTYFLEEDRDPTITELRMIDTYWSDHCRHTTFATILDHTDLNDEMVQASFDRYLDMRASLGRENTPITLMDLATIGAKYLLQNGQLHGLDVSEEINACSVRVSVEIDGKKEPWLLMFKNETHNHPTEIEPFGGAATCLGGAIRDPLSGRSYVYQAMRVTGAGDPLADMKDTLPGKLPQRKIVTTAAAGYSSYGNQIGLATGLVDEIYHPGYLAKRMEIGAVLGAAPEEQIRRERPSPGDLVILLGGRTGRDGCGGATGSSKSHTLSSLELSGAEVQKGNAPEERKLQRLFRNPAVTHLIKRCNDFGAGGVSVAIGELADGLNINLDAIPKKYEGLDGTELAISESQERMAVVIDPKDADDFLRCSREENLEATVVAEVTDTNRLVMHWKGNRIVDLSRSFLNSNGATKHAKVAVGPPKQMAKSGPQAKGFQEAMEHMVADLNSCSRKGLVERFDSTIGAATVLLPFGGTHQATPIQAMIAKLPVLKGETNTCSAMAYGYNPFLSEQDPYSGAYLAVVESVSKLVATGASYQNCYLTFQEYFEKLGSDPRRWGKPFSSLLGALDAQRDLSIGAIGGKDSMSGSFEELDVPPALVSFAVSVCDSRDIISPEFKKAGSKVVLLSPSYDERGLPNKDSLLACYQRVESLIRNKKVLSVYTPGIGAIAEALFKMSLGNQIGFQLSPEINWEQLFEVRYGSFVMEVSESTLLDKEYPIGTTVPGFHMETIDGIIRLEDLQMLYEDKMEKVYPTKSTSVMGQTPNISYHRVSRLSGPRQSIKPSKPKALIPVFPGTNCEYDTARALQAAGADPRVFVVRNLSREDVEESVLAMVSAIRESQIIVLPGGFSGGDEPDGSGKFITAFFRNPRIAQEVHEFLNQRDGLMCGICNGFQALIKLGLVPYGEIRDMDSHCPTLTYNEIGRHQSRLVRTRIASNLSPWLMDFQVGEIHTLPVSHGEGRFVAEESLLAELAAKGQIATQYVDLSGTPTMEIQYNPNGSLFAVEGITSPDGRVLGKMAHTERFQDGIYQNVPGNKSQPIFHNAVRYFSL